MSDRIRKLASLIRQDPTDPFPRYALALEVLKTGDLETSRRLFESVRELDNVYPGLAYQLGVLYHRLGRLDAARQRLEEGLREAERAHDDHTRRELLTVLLQVEADADAGEIGFP